MKSDKATGSGQIDTLIGAKTRIEGDIHFHGGLHIDGVVKGSIIADQDSAYLSVSDQGTVEGEIRVPEVVIDGVLKGNILKAERVELAPNARVTGNIEYVSIQMALGAQVTGAMSYVDSKAASAKNVTGIGSAGAVAKPGQ